MDPLFDLTYPFMNPSLQEKILADMNAIGGEESTVDDPDGKLDHLPLDKMSIILSEGKEHGMRLLACEHLKTRRNCRKHPVPLNSQPP